MSPKKVIKIPHCNKRLATADTLYWQLSPVDLYEELKTEISSPASVSATPLPPMVIIDY